MLVGSFRRGVLVSVNAGRGTVIAIVKVGHIALVADAAKERTRRE